VTKEKRLGRGLEALLGRLSSAPAPAEAPAADAGTEPVPAVSPVIEMTPAASAPAYTPPAARTLASFAAADMAARAVVPKPDPAPISVPELGPSRVAIARIDSNPHQPRQAFDEAEMQTLAESIQAHGLLQPVVVRRVKDRFQLIAGERRLRAATKAGWAEVPVLIVEANDRQVAELAIVENLQRKDLNPLEKAASFQRYLEQYHCTQEDLAARLKIDRSTIANLIRLLELPDAVQESIRRGKITQGHARALLPLGDEKEQVAFCQRIQQEGLSVRQTEAIVQETIEQADAEPLALVTRDGDKARPAKAQNEQVAALEQQFRSALGMKVALRHNSRGRGKLVIHFRNHEEFDRLRELLCDAKPQVRARAG
jgi:ParB family transcriptional regulator, chromosome partitioning protein